MTDPTEIARVAAGLTKAQREAVYQPCDVCGTPVKVHAVSPSQCTCSPSCDDILLGIEDE